MITPPTCACSMRAAARSELAVPGIQVMKRWPIFCSIVMVASSSSMRASIGSMVAGTVSAGSAAAG